MATVRFSEELRGDILSNAKALFTKRIDAVTQVEHPTWAQIVYDGMLSNYQMQMNALPENFFNLKKDVGIDGFRSKQDGVWDINLNRRVYLELADHRRFPADLNKEQSGLYEPSRYSGHTLDADDPRWDTLKAEYLTWSVACKAIVAERDNFMDGVSKVINAYSTLAPALKAWPPLWDLVPQHKKNKHLEIVERRKRGDATPGLEDLDLDKMTGVSVASKLTR